MWILRNISRPDHDVAVVGAGFSGIGAAIKLDKAGISRLRRARGRRRGRRRVALEHLSRCRRRHPVIQLSVLVRQARRLVAGLRARQRAEGVRRGLADKYDVRPRIRFNTRVAGATFDEDAQLWRLEINDGDRDPLHARLVIGATGVFSQPKPPDIAGLDDFAGKVMHTARWDHGADLTGKRVGDDRHRRLGRAGDPVDRARGGAPHRLPAHADLVPAEARRRALRCGRLGAPMRSGRARSLTRAAEPGLRRSRPSRSRPTSTAIIPLGRRGEVVGRRHLRDQVHDPEVRDKLTPQYGLGCKRPSFSQRVPADLQPRQRPSRDDVDRSDHAGRCPHVGRHRARDRRADPRDRVQGVRGGQHAAVPGLRRRRSQPRGVVGREPLPGLRGRQRPRLPEHVPDPRALRLSTAPPTSA